VNETSGDVVLYNDEVADTYFFSSSGGKTANVQDVWPGSPALPYLVSVPDPYDTLSPYHDWGPLKMNGTQLGKRLGVKGTLLDVRTAAGADGRVRSVTLLGPKGSRTMSGSTVRAALGLRSTWFTIGTLSLTQPTRTLEYGTQTRLLGLARGIPRVTLESRPYGGEWKILAVLKSRGGQVAATLSPKVTTDYRISSGIARSPVVRVSVAPSVRLTASSDRTAVTGLVKPLLPGAQVQVQRQGPSGTWTTVATTTVTSDGAFEASVDLKPGTYRARVVAGKGFAAGLSPVLTVVSA
jgi:SpoIID/LytB domain protein